MSRSGSKEGMVKYICERAPKHMFIKSIHKGEVYSRAQSREHTLARILCAVHIKVTKKEKCVRRTRVGQMKSGGLEFLESR